MAVQWPEKARQDLNEGVLACGCSRYARRAEALYASASESEMFGDVSALRWRVAQCVRRVRESAVMNQSLVSVGQIGFAAVRQDVLACSIA